MRARALLNSPSKHPADYEGDDLEALSTMRRYRDWIVDHFRPYLHGDAVEIGAGIGNMADHVLPHVQSLRLIEPSTQLIERLRSRFADNKVVSVAHCDFDEFVRQADDGAYDCIILINLLEHIDDDGAALKKARRILSRDGHIMILVPALPFLFSKLDAKHGHYRRYTKNRLRKVIEDAGFDVEYSNYFDFMGVLPWYLLNTLGGITTFNSFLMSVYDVLFVPITRALESWMSPPIGKNLIAIGRQRNPRDT